MALQLIYSMMKDSPTISPLDIAAAVMGTLLCIVFLLLMFNVAH